MKSFTQKESKFSVLSYGLYKMYKAKFKGPYRASECNVSYVAWLRICKKFNQRIFSGMVQGYIFKMPYRLGSLGVVQQKKKIKFKADGTLDTHNLRINWDKTIKLWKEMYPECIKRSDYKEIKNKPVVYHTNEHTDGRYMKFHWKKKGTCLKNKSVYSFTPSFAYTQELTKLIQSNPNVQFCTHF